LRLLVDVGVLARLRTDEGVLARLLTDEVSELTRLRIDERKEFHTVGGAVVADEPSTS